MGWTYSDLDWALRSIDPQLPLQISEAILVQLAKIKDLQYKYDLTVEEVCSFWKDMKTVGPFKENRCQALFDEVFKLKTLKNSEREGE